ncbi:MAG TPA: glycerate kinase [Anaerolineae bacterium]|nr:glycerate kinase [Anaerolineae bacterium]
MDEFAQERGWRQQAAEIMAAALEAVEPKAALHGHVRRQGTWLQVAEQRYDLAEFRRIFVVGGGKAGTPMLQATAELLGDRLTAALVNVKKGHTVAGRQVCFSSQLPVPSVQRFTLASGLEIVEAGHPVPDAAGLAGAGRIHALLTGLSAQDLVICLISGGGSALLPLPAAGISLADLQALTGLLLRSGATINEINAVRKHCSQLKGGRLAQHAAPATVICLILSDVVGSPLETIGSGPTVADPSTFADAYAVLTKYGVLETAPSSVVAHLRRGMVGEIAETPKPGDPCFDRVQNLIIGDNRLAARAAQAKAEALGLSAAVLTTFVEGEAREVAKVCVALAKEMVSSGAPLAPPACLILGGETTVTVRGEGKGGRNQELALAAALAMEGLEGAAVVCLATDGTDGPTDAAGAIATGTTVARARDLGLDATRFLADNDAYPFFAALGDLVFTGPTNTNVNDLTFVFAL